MLLDVVTPAGMVRRDLRVENGRIAFPVQEVTVAGNLRDMFRGIDAVGADTELRGNLRCGSLLVDGMTVAGA